MLVGFFGCAKNNTSSNNYSNVQLQPLYSQAGREYKAHFEGIYRSNYKEISDIQPGYLIGSIRENTKFLFGPLTYRSLGGIQKGEKITPHPEQAVIENGRVLIPFSYEGVWMVHFDKVPEQYLELPLPFSVEDLSQTNWLSCTDATDDDHATLGFLWYFWDPSRPGCKHKKDFDYQIVKIHFDQPTEQTVTSYPEYNRMIRQENGRSVLSMTFAFGYVEDNQHPRPFKDSDAGMVEFRKFYEIVRKTLVPQGFTETALLQKTYTSGSEKIGARFIGKLNGLEYRVSVVSNAGVDQMELFAHSFAAEHDAFFGWFGHSRVGDGFDATQFRYILSDNPNQFSMSNQYQLVYWAGCNSYSYYTLPFFDLKARNDAANDPKGTKNLDIISNTLPSLFAFNANNANVMFQAIMNKNRNTSYQEIIGKIEDSAQNYGYDVIVNVLGDEDNGDNK